MVVHEEIRRRERVIRIFPNEESAVRLIGAFVIGRDGDWVTGRKYMDMADYLTWRKAGKVNINLPGGRQVVAA